MKQIAIRHQGNIYLLKYNPELYTEGQVRDIIAAETLEHGNDEDYEDLNDYECSSEFEITGPIRGYNGALMSLLAQLNGQVSFTIR